MGNNYLLLGQQQTDRCEPALFWEPRMSAASVGLMSATSRNKTVVPEKTADLVRLSTMVRFILKTDVRGWPLPTNATRNLLRRPRDWPSRTAEI
jgi:hypothetical protein